MFAQRINSNNVHLIPTRNARTALRDHDGRTLLEGTAHAAGLEVFGDTDRLLALRG